MTVEKTIRLSPKYDKVYVDNVEFDFINTTVRLRFSAKEVIPGVTKIKSSKEEGLADVENDCIVYQTELVMTPQTFVNMADFLYKSKDFLSQRFGGQ